MTPPRPTPILHHHNHAANGIGSIDYKATTESNSVESNSSLTHLFYVEHYLCFRHVARGQSSKCGDSSQTEFESAGLHLTSWYASSISESH